jgi:hypothetical protein
MADHVIRISEAEAASDFAGLLARVRAGMEVVIESGKLPVAVVHLTSSYCELRGGSSLVAWRSPLVWRMSPDSSRKYENLPLAGSAGHAVMR